MPAAWVLGVVFFGVLACLFFIRKRVVIALFSHLLVGLCLISVVLGNWHTGGLAMANDVILFVVPLLAVFLLGQQGLVWVVISLLVYAVFVCLDMQGFVFPNLIPPEARSFCGGLGFFISLMAACTLVFLNERFRRVVLRKLVLSKNKAEGANKAKDRFLANMSHELRTPLNAIMGLTEVMSQGGLDAEQKKQLGLLKASANSLLVLVDEVLDMSRIELGQVKLSFGPFDPAVQLKEICDCHRPMAMGKGLSLSVEILESVPSVVNGDVHRLGQVLSNLIDNAIKYTDTGHVVVRLGWESDALVYEFQDTGMGLDASFLDEIFNAFSRADTTLTRRQAGLGLGLAISQELVELMGGTIRVESQVGVGSTFTVRLKLSEVMPAQGFRSGRFLLVEDDAVGRDLATTILERDGFKVKSVGDGEDAIQEALSGDFDLVLMDVQMPGMDGLQASREIRKGEPGHRRMPIVALTAHALDEERKRCMAAGMDDFISKPIVMEVFLGKVRRWMGEG
jgi:signal transduction histidine kinase